MLAGLASILAGCVTTATNTLSPAEVQTLRLTEVRVSVPVEAGIVGYDALTTEYAAAKRIPNHELNAGTETEEAKAWARNHLQARVKTAMEKQLGETLRGQRPVRAEVVVKGFQLSSAVQRIVVGGDYRMVADVTLVDAKSGAVITSYPEMLHRAVALNGWGGAIVQAVYDASNPPGDRVVNGFAEQYKAWLVKS
ncbi:MAG: DUF6778 family protein [Pseudorhodoplanes sp.]